MAQIMVKRRSRLSVHHKHFDGYMKSGIALTRMCQYNKALAKYAVARQHAREIMPDSKLELSRCLLYIADVYRQKGNHHLAEDLYEKSIAYAAKQLGKKHHHVVWLQSRVAACTKVARESARRDLVSNGLTQVAVELLLVGVQSGGFSALISVLADTIS